MNRTEKIEQFLRELDTEIDILDYVDAEDVECFEDVLDQIEGGFGFDVEIIYYANAMEYLMEHDVSLTESLTLADEMGYSPGNLNSEVLATLLASQKAREDFMELEDEITEFFDELEDDDEDDI